MVCIVCGEARPTPFTSAGAVIMSKHLMGEFEHLVMLAILRLGDDAYGVSIARELERRAGRDVSQAAVYLTLRRLDEKGWLVARVGESSERRGGRKRRYYSVTPQGRERLREGREVLLAMWSGITEELA